MRKNKTENAVIKSLILLHLSKKLLRCEKCKNSNDVFLMLAFCTFLQKSIESNEKVRKVNTRFF